MKNNLFTTDAEISKNREELFEQYKLYVKLTDTITQRRATANSFYISANLALLTVLSWLQNNVGKSIFLVAIGGIVISILWFFSIRSYKQLNSGRYDVIREIENQLPLHLFTYEWEILKEGKDFKTYWSLSKIEGFIPLVFIGLYVAISVLFTIKEVCYDI